MILITGITGRTGKYLIEELKNNHFKQKIRCIVRQGSDLSYLQDSGLDYQLAVGDLNDHGYLIDACRDIDTILSIYNISHSLNVLDAALKNNIKRIILVHTTGIYSKFKMASAEYKNIEEKVFARAKGKVDLTILRPTMIYGDLCDNNISKFIKMIDKLTLFPMIAGGRAKIQPVNSRDLGKAYYQVLVNPETTKNKSYNLSGSEEIKIIDMLKLIGSFLGKKTKFLNVPIGASVLLGYSIKLITLGKIDIVEKILRMDEDRCFSHQEAVLDFGYTPEGFAAGIAREVTDYMHNKSK